jgi:hypothetical protein
VAAGGSIITDADRIELRLAAGVVHASEATTGTIVGGANWPILASSRPGKPRAAIPFPSASPAG